MVSNSGGDHYNGKQVDSAFTNKAVAGGYMEVKVFLQQLPASLIHKEKGEEEEEEMWAQATGSAQEVQFAAR